MRNSKLILQTASILPPVSCRSTYAPAPYFSWFSDAQILKIIFISIFSITAFLPNGANAACTSPAGVSGAITYTGGTIKFCNGTSWVDTTNASIGSCAGTTAGTFKYVSNYYEYCNGTTWYSMQGNAINSCAGTTAGTLSWNSGTSVIKFCDGTNWYDTTATTSTTSTTTTTAPTCLGSGATWDDGHNHCPGDGAVCGSYGDIYQSTQNGYCCNGSCNEQSTGNYSPGLGCTTVMIYCN